MSPSPQPLLVANWKMFLSLAESVRAARAIRVGMGRGRVRAVETVLCPSFPALIPVGAVLKGSRLSLGAQDVHPAVSGPFTGDVSVAQLRGVARYVIVGHSERRERHGETDELVARKTGRALAAGLRPIICVGETAAERKKGETVAVVRRQVEEALRTVSAPALARCVFAYEPRWAISGGPGQPAPQPSPAEASEIIRFIRRAAAGRAGSRYAGRLRVLYGGSVDARSGRSFFREPGVDGALVGAASLQPAKFVKLAQILSRCR